MKVAVAAISLFFVLLLIGADAGRVLRRLDVLAKAAAARSSRERSQARDATWRMNAEVESLIETGLEYGGSSNYGGDVPTSADMEQQYGGGPSSVLAPDNAPAMTPEDAPASASTEPLQPAAPDKDNEPSKEEKEASEHPSLDDQQQQAQDQLKDEASNSQMASLYKEDLKDLKEQVKQLDAASGSGEETPAPVATDKTASDEPPVDKPNPNLESQKTEDEPDTPEEQAAELKKQIEQNAKLGDMYKSENAETQQQLNDVLSGDAPKPEPAAPAADAPSPFEPAPKEEPKEEQQAPPEPEYGGAPGTPSASEEQQLTPPEPSGIPVEHEEPKTEAQQEQEAKEAAVAAQDQAQEEAQQQQEQQQQAQQEAPTPEPPVTGEPGEKPDATPEMPPAPEQPAEEAQPEQLPAHPTNQPEPEQDQETKQPQPPAPEKTKQPAEEEQPKQPEPEEKGEKKGEEKGEEQPEQPAQPASEEDEFAKDVEQLVKSKLAAGDTAKRVRKLLHEMRRFIEDEIAEADKHFAAEVKRLEAEEAGVEGDKKEIQREVAAVQRMQKALRGAIEKIDGSIAELTAQMPGEQASLIERSAAASMSRAQRHAAFAALEARVQAVTASRVHARKRRMLSSAGTLLAALRKVAALPPHRVFVDVAGIKSALRQSPKASRAAAKGPLAVLTAASSAFEPQATTPTIRLREAETAGAAADKPKHHKRGNHGGKHHGGRDLHRAIRSLEEALKAFEEQMNELGRERRQHDKKQREHKKPAPAPAADEKEDYADDVPPEAQQQQQPPAKPAEPAPETETPEQEAKQEMPAPRPADDDRIINVDGKDYRPVGSGDSEAKEAEAPAERPMIVVNEQTYAQLTAAEADRAPADGEERVTVDGVVYSTSPPAPQETLPAAPAETITINGRQYERVPGDDGEYAGAVAEHHESQRAGVDEPAGTDSSEALQQLMLRGQLEQLRAQRALKVKELAAVEQAERDLAARLGDADEQLQALRDLEDVLKSALDANLQRWRDEAAAIDDIARKHFGAGVQDADESAALLEDAELAVEHRRLEKAMQRQQQQQRRAQHRKTAVAGKHAGAAHLAPQQHQHAKPAAAKQAAHSGPQAATASASLQRNKQRAASRK